MASTKLMASSISRNSDLRRKSSSSSSTKSSSISNLQTDGANEISLLDAAGAITAISDNEVNRVPMIRRQESVSNSRTKTAEEVWKEIVAGGGSVRREFKQELPEDSPDVMTLEDFLARAEAVEEQEAKAEPILGTLSLDFVVDHPILPILGKRRSVVEPLDKISQQRQKRMIKNRESAARSRERKQAYQAELESLAVRLEEEHEQLLKEQAEEIAGRRKQLIENIIPVVEKRRPKRTLQRVQSTEW